MVFPVHSGCAISLENPFKRRTCTLCCTLCCTLWAMAGMAGINICHSPQLEHSHITPNPNHNRSHQTLMGYAHGNIITQYRLGTMSQQTGTGDPGGEGSAAASRQNELEIPPKVRRRLHKAPTRPTRTAAATTTALQALARTAAAASL